MIIVITQNSRRRTNEYMNERVRMYAYFPSVSCCWSTSDQIATTNGDDERRATTTNDDERNDERKNDVTRCTRASERASERARREKRSKRAPPNVLLVSRRISNKRCISFFFCHVLSFAFVVNYLNPISPRWTTTIDEDERKWNER